MPQIFLLQKPFHEFFQHFTHRVLGLKIHLKSFRSCEIILYSHNLCDELRTADILNSAYILQFRVILSFFDNFDCLLTNVITNVFSFMTFGSTIMDYCFSSVSSWTRINNMTSLLTLIDLDCFDPLIRRICE